VFPLNTWFKTGLEMNSAAGKREEGKSTIE
jgi:hypothetical protein